MNIRKYFKKSTDQKQSKDIRTLKKKVKTLEAPVERKWLDVPIVQNIGSTTTAVALNAILIADQDGTVSGNNSALNRRVGKSCMMTKLRIKGIVFSLRNPLPANQSARMRMVIVRWPSCSEAMTSYTMNTFIRSAPYVGAPLSDDAVLDGFKEPYPRNKYEILYDRVFNLQTTLQTYVEPVVGPPAVPGQVPTSTDKWRFPVNINIKLNKECRWAELESVLSTPTNNGICAYFFSDATAPGFVSVQMNSRLNFLDN